MRHITPRLAHARHIALEAMGRWLLSAACKILDLFQPVVIYDVLALGANSEGGFVGRS